MTGDHHLEWRVPGRPVAQVIGGVMAVVAAAVAVAAATGWVSAGAVALVVAALPLRAWVFRPGFPLALVGTPEGLRWQSPLALRPEVVVAGAGPAPGGTIAWFRVPFPERDDLVTVELDGDPVDTGLPLAAPPEGTRLVASPPPGLRTAAELGRRLALLTAGPVP